MTLDSVFGMWLSSNILRREDGSCSGAVGTSVTCLYLRSVPMGRRLLELDENSKLAVSV